MKLPTLTASQPGGVSIVGVGDDSVVVGTVGIVHVGAVSVVRVGGAICSVSLSVL